MKIKIVHPFTPVASNLSHKEFLAEAHDRFPQPSEFLADFLQRYEALADLEAAVEKRHYEEEKAHDIDCPACGTSFTVEVELDSL